MKKKYIIISCLVLFFIILGVILFNFLNSKDVYVEVYGNEFTLKKGEGAILKDFDDLKIKFKKLVVTDNCPKGAQCDMGPSYDFYVLVDDSEFNFKYGRNFFDNYVFTIIKFGDDYITLNIVNRKDYALTYDYVNNYSFDVVEESDTNFYDISQRGYYTYTDHEYDYFMVTMGEKSTGGYSIFINSFDVDDSGNVSVVANEVSPKEGDIVTQVITFPYIIFKISPSVNSIKIVNQDGVEFIKLN